MCERGYLFESLRVLQQFRFVQLLFNSISRNHHERVHIVGFVDAVCGVLRPHFQDVMVSGK